MDNTTDDLRALPASDLLGLVVLTASFPYLLDWPLASRGVEALNSYAAKILPTVHIVALGSRLNDRRPIPEQLACCLHHVIEAVSVGAVVIIKVRGVITFRAGNVEGIALPVPLKTDPRVRAEAM